jgi:hypothetical protein
MEDLLATARRQGTAFADVDADLARVAGEEYEYAAPVAGLNLTGGSYCAAPCPTTPYDFHRPVPRYGSGLDGGCTPIHRLTKRTATRRRGMTQASYAVGHRGAPV